MTILTHAMKTARSDHYGLNLKAWFPCNEGSGDTVADRILGLVETDSTTAEHDNPHSIGISVGANTALLGLDAVNLPSKGMYIVVAKPTIVVATLNSTLGSVAVDETGLQITGAAVTLRTSGGTVFGATGLTVVSDLVIAVVWDENNLYTYAAESGVDATLVDTDAISSAISSVLPEAFTAVSTESSLSLHGRALFDFTNDGLPSDLLTGINWMKDEWQAGHKVIYEAWKSRT